MRKIYLLLTVIFLTAANVFSQDVCGPVGWATQNGGVTGGGNATPVVVSNYNDLKAAVTNENVRVVHIQGTITFPSNGRINIQDQSNKTIFGLPGSKLISTDLSSGGSGIFYVKRMENFILQNVYFEGPGAYDTDGNDNLTVDDCRNVWVDHCEFHDGMDGNFDIKNKADYISVTWCTFSYEKPPISGGSGGSNDHRYTNLIGSSDGATADDGKLRVTFQYCWWGEGCRERMPRVRYGKIHLVNNYYSSSVANHGIRAGYKADIRAEGNYFISGFNKPIDLFDGDYTAVYSTNSVGVANYNNGSVFTPPYSIAIANPNSIITPITTCAGQTIPGWGACSSCSGGGGNAYPTVSITSPTNNQVFSSNPNITINANASDSDGSISKVEFYNGSTLLGTDFSSSYSYTWNNVPDGNYTIIAKAYDNEGATATSSIAITVGDGGNTGQPATLQKRGSGSSTQSISLGSSITGFYYEWANANTVSVSGLPNGVNVDINTSEKTATFSGTPTQSGVFNWTITTVGGDPEATKSGSITVTGGASNNAPTISIASPANNSTYTAPASITLTANASDSDGSVTLIEYFNSGSKIGEGTSYTWNNVAQGNYTITAVATDDDGAKTTSSAISVTVNAAQTTDCNGVLGGSAYLDGCGNCVGGNTGQDPCTPTCNDVGVVFGQTGYATQGPGTTGGAGGDEVTVTNGVDLQDAINNATGPRIIYINGTINEANSTGLSKIDIKDVSDISIIGLPGAEFDGIGLKIWRASNIIIQNVTVHHVLTGDKDGLNIEGPSNNIWVDHCEFYNEYEGVDKDYYDALLDLKRDVDNVTISWNYFHDSWKCSLAGSSETDTYNRTVTYHHNFYENINSRLPLFRSGYGHVFNNYYKDIASTTINSRINACVKIENNYFLNAQNPYVSAYSDVVGYGDVEGNILENSPFVYASDVFELGACTASIPYNYANYLNCAENVPSIVEQYAGVDKSISNQPPTVSITSPVNGATFDAPADINITANANDSDGNVVSVEFFENNNSLGTDNTSAYAYNWTGVTEGNYIIKVVATDNDGATATATISITVNAPANLDCNGDPNGEATIDNCGICSGGNTGITACTGAIQAEDACAYDGTVDSNNAGFNGTGFVNTTNTIGSSVLIAINATNNTTTDLGFVYANGGGTDRPATISVNGNPAGTIVFGTTGSWEAWNVENISVQLTAGTNVIELVATTADGIANLDQINVFETGVTLGSCEEDCNGDRGGTATQDVCGKCVGGNTGEVSVDSDNDGTLDCEDLCPNDANKTEPGLCGCGNVDEDIDNDNICDAEDDDLDNDGVTTTNDCDDNNPAIGAGSVWYIDADGDGVGNTQTQTVACTKPAGYVSISGDNCPDDINKTQPGNCGCGNSEESCLDCAGVSNGSAALDACNQCAGGTTGITPVTNPDECIATSVEELQGGNVIIYPNPSIAAFTIKTSGAFSYKLYTISGIQVAQGVGENDIIIGENLASGAYILKVITSDMDVSILNIIKE